MERPDIHGYDVRLRAEYRRLDGSSMLPGNREAIRGFVRVLESMGLNKGRIAKLMFILITIGEHVSKPFHDMTKQDVQELMAQINSQDRSPLPSRYHMDSKNKGQHAIKGLHCWSQGCGLAAAAPCGPVNGCAALAFIEFEALLSPIRTGALRCLSFWAILW